jgi:hypothetical protein
MERWRFTNKKYKRYIKRSEDLDIFIASHTHAVGHSGHKHILMKQTPSDATGTIPSFR